MEWNLNTVISIGMRLITHRVEVQAMWTRVEKLINEAALVFPELQILMAKLAPELVTVTAKGVGTLPPVQQAHAYNVMWLQQSLNVLLPANLKVDGIIGNATRQAIESFQRSRGLVDDGWAGALTTAAIDAEMRQRA